MTTKTHVTTIMDSSAGATLSTTLGVPNSIIDADDIATAEDIRLHDIARQEYLSGETVSFPDIDWS